MYRIVSVTMMIVMTCTARVKTTERPSDVPTHTHTHTPCTVHILLHSSILLQVMSGMAAISLTENEAAAAW